MAGHSKWANIKHRKGNQDAKRGKIFTKHIRAITVAAKMGGGALDANPRLRGAVDKALAVNMTRDTINRAIKRGSGDGDDAQLLDMRYEGYGTAGVAVIVDCLSDNRNRTVAEVRHAFSKHGGNLGAEGSVAYQFHKKGMISFNSRDNEEKITDIAIDNGASDISYDSDNDMNVICDPDTYDTIVDALKAAQLEPTSQQLTLIPDIEVELDLEQSEKLLRLVDALEDLDDVQEVHTNAQLAEALFTNE